MNNTLSSNICPFVYIKSSPRRYFTFADVTKKTEASGECGPSAGSRLSGPFCLSHSFEQSHFVVHIAISKQKWANRQIILKNRTTLEKQKQEKNKKDGPIRSSKSHR